MTMPRHQPPSGDGAAVPSVAESQRQRRPVVAREGDTALVLLPDRRGEMKPMWRTGSPNGWRQSTGGGLFRVC